MAKNITWKPTITHHNDRRVKHPYVRATFHSPYSDNTWEIKYYASDYSTIVKHPEQSFCIGSTSYPQPKYVSDFVTHAGQQAMAFMSCDLGDLDFDPETWIKWFKPEIAPLGWSVTRMHATIGMLKEYIRVNR